ncbi:BTB/POZ protein [Rhizophagus irregularis DAOM 181602=DAOM 197198]|nr:BTB/POZ protein [Rhizophagus irregularis DAOM 181602=DAOM 197198]
MASNKKKDNGLAHIKFPNISPEIFQIILRYIYGGTLSLNEQETSDFLKVLAVADELRLQELNNFKAAILSIVKSTNNALNYHPGHGPCFGNDLLIYTSDESEDSADMDFDGAEVYDGAECYENSIREKGKFPMEDYEVFQIIE